jgi:hypothetical protein
MKTIFSSVSLMQRSRRGQFLPALLPLVLGLYWEVY